MKRLVRCILLLLCCCLALTGTAQEALAPGEPTSAGEGLMPYSDAAHMTAWVYSEKAKGLLYEEVAEIAGVEGYDRGHINANEFKPLGEHEFEWFTEGDEGYYYLRVTFRGQPETGRFELDSWISNFPEEVKLAADYEEWVNRPKATPVPGSAAETTAAPTQTPMIEAAATAVPTPQAESPAAPDEDMQAFTGEWYCVWMHAGLVDGDPRAMFGMDTVLTLNPDGTATLLQNGGLEYDTWEKDEDGVIRYWGAGTALQLIGDGWLQYGTELSGYMIFSRDRNAKAEDRPETASGYTAAAPAANVQGGEAPDWLVGSPFVATEYTAGGMTLDPALMGGYGLKLNADGTAEFTMAGITTPGFTWRVEGDNIIIGAYASDLMTLTLLENETVSVDYSGAFVLKMVKQQ